MNSAPSKVVVERRYEAQARACSEALKRLLAPEKATELLLERSLTSKEVGLTTTYPGRLKGDQAVGNKKGAQPSKASPNDP
jgi:hypothetical protein